MSANTRGMGETLFNRWTAMWNGELALAREIVADGFWVHLTARAFGGPEAIRNAEQVAAWVGRVRGSFESLTYAMAGQPFVDVEQSTVICPWFVDGVFAGKTSAPGDVAGKPFRKLGIDILRFRDGRIHECWTLSNEQLAGVPYAPPEQR